MRQRRTLKELEPLCDAWNARYPIGTPVKLFKTILKRPDDLIGTFTTQTPAEILGGHSAVVWVMGYAGCVSLDVCEAVDVQP